MTYVVIDNCIRCRHTECVDICPADAFHAGENFLVINPEECVDCGLCVPECPEEAILAESDLNDEQMQFKKINADLSGDWPVIMEKEEPLPDWKEWSGVEGKIKYLPPQ